MKKRRGHLYLRGGIYWLRYQVNGQRFAHSLKTSDRRTAQTEAARLMAPIQAADAAEALRHVQTRLTAATATAERLADEAHPPPGIRQGWGLYLDSETRPRSGPETLRDYERHLDRFTRWLAAKFPDVKHLRDVTGDHAAGFIRYLERDLNLSGNRINKHTVFLRCFFRHVAKAARCTGPNPFEGIAHRRHIATSKRPLTVEELRSIIEKADGEMKTLFMLGTFTGLRFADCCTLRWDEVDLARGIVRRIPRKTARTGKAVLIGLPEILVQHLAGLKRTGPLVLPGIARDWETDSPGLSRRIQAHFKACGIETTRAGTDETRAVVVVGFHSLRHSFVSLHAQAGTPQAILQKLAGHSNPMMTQHYVNLSEQSARAVADALPVAELTGAPAPKSTREPLPRWAAELVKKMTPKNWKIIHAELMEARA